MISSAFGLPYLSLSNYFILIWDFIQVFFYFPSLHIQCIFRGYQALALGTDNKFTCIILFTGYFWQVTDFHYDANYSIKGNPLKMCHDLSDGHYGNSIYGNYHCDSPWLLIQSATAAMKRIQPDPDFILWTGFVVQCSFFFSE